MTHGDEIRQMTDEELAGILYCNQCIYCGMPECESPDCAYGIMTWLKQEVEDILKQPVIEAEPARHGRWIMLEPYGAHHTRRRKCSECGEIKAQELTNFCPDCGADMMGKRRCK